MIDISTIIPIIVGGSGLLLASTGLGLTARNARRKTIKPINFKLPFSPQLTQNLILDNYPYWDVGDRTLVRLDKISANQDLFILTSMLTTGKPNFGEFSLSRETIGDLISLGQEQGKPAPEGLDLSVLDRIDYPIIFRFTTKTPDELAGGLNIYADMKDFGKVLLKFRPRWYIQQIYQRVINIVWDGTRIAEYWTLQPDLSYGIWKDDGIQNLLAGGIHIDRDIVYCSKVCPTGDCGHWSYYVWYFDFNPGTKKSDPYNEWEDSRHLVGRIHREKTSLAPSYEALGGSGLEYNSIFIKMLLQMAYPDIPEAQWSLISNGYGYDQPGYENVDTIKHYLMAMQGLQRTTEWTDVFKFIWALVDWIASWFREEVAGMVTGALNVLNRAVAIQERGQGSAFLQGIKRIEIILNNVSVANGTLNPYFIPWTHKPIHWRISPYELEPVIRPYRTWVKRETGPWGAYREISLYRLKWLMKEYLAQKVSEWWHEALTRKIQRVPAIRISTIHMPRISV